jgi:hypothetical protein
LGARPAATGSIGLARMSVTVVFNFCMIASGVPFGAIRANQVTEVKSGMPDSRTVGTSGKWRAFKRRFRRNDCYGHAGKRFRMKKYLMGLRRSLWILGVSGSDAILVQRLLRAY